MDLKPTPWEFSPRIPPAGPWYVYSKQLGLASDPPRTFHPCPMGFLYIVKNGDLTKIGITTNIGRRMGQLKPSKICTVVELEEARSLEKKLHKRFKGSRLPQSEYFRLSDSSLRKACAQAMEAGVPISLEKVPLEKAKTQVKKGRGRAKPPRAAPGPSQQERLGRSHCQPWSLVGQ